MYAIRSYYEHKSETNGLPIRQFPFAPMIILPMAQHIGAPSQVIVREGQEVSRGQLLAKAGGYVSVPLHAPVSGTIRKIGNVPSITGKIVITSYSIHYTKLYDSKVSPVKYTVSDREISSNGTFTQREVNISYREE